MNKSQRNRLGEILETLNGLYEEVNGMADEERDKFDAMPENLQNSLRGEVFQANADTMNDIADSISTAADEIEGLIQE